MLHFLGFPHALRGQERARLRSQECWAVLASLVMPSVLRGLPPAPVARDTLADRFWGDSESVEPRTHLRQCVGSLRAVFGKDCLLADRDALQAAPGWFRTDIGEVLTACREAERMSAPEERLAVLAEAETLAAGLFFEGWRPDSEESELWLVHQRAEVRSRLQPFYLLLARTLEEVGNPNGAFDIARRMLETQPEYGPARELAWRLAVDTGRQDVMNALEGVSGFREAVARFPSSGLRKATLREGRLFRSLFAAELALLPPRQRRAVLRLSAFPGRFSALLAERVCRVPALVLKKLAETPFLRTEGSLYLQPDVIRECAERQLSSGVRRVLQRRLALFCIDTLLAPVPLSEPFATLETAQPLLYVALSWVLAQPPDERHLGFINMLRHYGYLDLAERGFAYQCQVADDSSLPPRLRLNAAANLSYLHVSRSDHGAAVQILENFLPLTLAVEEPDYRGGFLNTLTIACHYAGNSEAAIHYGLQALERIRSRQANADDSDDAEAWMLRFLGEIHTHTGKLDIALDYCESALRKRRDRGMAAGLIADALYWRARCLLYLKRFPEALVAAEETFTLWEREGDHDGVGFCLRLIAQIRATEGCYGEAQGLLEYAALLHQKTGQEPNRIAALEALGDIFTATQRKDQADACYAQCLAFFRTKAQPIGIERVERKRTEG